MNLLWIVVLIQTIFFIVQNEHLFVFMFIGLSLCINAFSKNDLVYLGLPIIMVFGIYFYIRDYKIKKEGFKKFSVKGAAKSVSKGATNTWNDAKDGVGQASSYLSEQAEKQYKAAREQTTKIVNNTIEQSKRTLSNAANKFNEFKKMVENTVGENDDYDQPEDIDYSYDKPEIDIPGEVEIPPDMEPLEEPPPEVQPTKAQKEADETVINGDEYGLDSL